MDKRERPSVQLDLIADAYNYKSVGEDFEKTEKQELDLNWELIRENINPALNSMALNFDESEEVEPKDHLEKIIVQEGFVFKFKKDSFQGDSVLTIDLQTVDDTEIANFDLRQDINGWNLSHRVVRPAFEGQGIATQIVQLCESFVQTYADSQKEPQTLYAEAGQVNMWRFFMNQGFNSTKEQEPEFLDTLNALENGEDEFVLVSNPVKPETQSWYVYKRDMYEKWIKNPNFWCHDEESDSVPYQEQATRFRFKKTIRPSTVQNLAEDVLARVRKVSP